MKNSNNSEMGNLVKFLRQFKEIGTLSLIPNNLLWWCVKSIAMNDPAHNLGHVLDVVRLGNELATKEGLDYDARLKVNLACLFHDLGCRYNRDDHHVIGYGMCYTLLEEHWPEQFNPKEICEIAVAVLEHRSSNKSKPSSLISEIVSVADSGKPDILTYIKRSLQFRISRGDLENKGKETLFLEVSEHLNEKFGSSDGYHWVSYPELGKRHFSEEWGNFDIILSDKSILLDRIESVYNKL